MKDMIITAVTAFMGGLILVILFTFDRMSKPPDILKNPVIFAIGEEQKIICRYEGEWTCKAFESVYELPSSMEKEK